MTELPFIGKGEHAYGPLDLKHSDVCSPLSINAGSGLPSSMIVHDLGTWILRDMNLNPLKSSENS